MNPTKEFEILKAVKHVAWQCHLYREDKISLGQWQSACLDAVLKTNELTKTHTEGPTEQQKKDAKVSLLSWALDIRTQDWAMQNHVNLDRKTQWRWVDKDLVTAQGEIIGIPSIRGVPRITNGIYVYIERADGSIFKCHLDNFIKDKAEKEARERKQSRRDKKEEEFRQRVATEYV